MKHHKLKNCTIVNIDEQEREGTAHMTKENVIVVASKPIYDFIHSNYSGTWNIQRQVTSIDDLWTGLGDTTLSNTSSVIMIHDEYFDATGNDPTFEQTVAAMIPHACVMIFNYREDEQVYIQEKIIMENESLNGSDYPPNFWFISKNNPIQDINDAYVSWQATLYEQEASQQVTHVTETEERAPKARGKVISVTSSKGGSGKSSTSIMLASQISLSSLKSFEAGKVSRPLSVVLVDMDIRDGQIGMLINKMDPTALNLRTEPVWDQAAISRNLVDFKHGGFKALLATKKPRASEDTPPEFYREIILQLRQMFDIVLLDTSVNYLDPLLEEVCYPLSDAILFVTDLGVSSVLGLARWKSEVCTPIEQGGMGVDEKIVSIVVNKFLPNVEMDSSRIKMAGAPCEIIATIPNQPEAFMLMANLGRLDKMLVKEDVGNVIFNLAANVVGPSYPLVPLVVADDITRRRVAQTAPQIEEPPRKKGIFRR